ncbi:MAG: exo-alpha-sialidase [Verrucomicrobia bacterium]|nr:exo-alpha-sialidase [Verrucomicrobiota bacterium]
MLLPVLVVGGTLLSGASRAAPAESFLGGAVFLNQRLFPGRGALDVLVARNGSVLAFHRNTLRESTDGGATWGAAREIGRDAGGKTVYNEIKGEILYVRADKGYLWKSRDDGRTWSRETIQVRPNRFGHGSPDTVPLSVGAFQPGITLQFGPRKGRLLMATRVMGPTGSNDVEWRPYHYNAAIFSDDGGATWQVSAPFPVLGSGEGALAELSDGRILYSSREHMSVGNRYFGWSHDGGELWLSPWQSDTLPDGARGTSYGCMGGLIRLPIEGADVLLYSNLDTSAGIMPKKVGGSTSAGREKITVWASFDGGKTWPVKRLVHDGPSAYSNLGVGRAGTPSEGRIFLNYEGGDKHCYEAVYVATFNLTWLLNGRELRDFLQR